MEELEPLFKCRIEELPFLGKLLLISFIRDKDGFITISPDYADPFTENFQNQVKLVEELVNPKKLTSEMKVLTQKLAVHFTHSRNLVNRLEIYINKAVSDNLPLTMASSDFGIKLVRQEVNLKNDEGVIKNLKDLKKNLSDNLTSLVAKGYTVAVQTELTTLIKDLGDDSIAQTTKKKEREKLVNDNISELNNLWSMMNDVMKAGKTYAKEKDPVKIKDYTYDHIIKDVQLKRKEEEKKDKAETVSENKTDKN
jgi:hypothetical protein